MVIASNAPVPSFKVEKRENDVVLETSQIIARVSLTNGVVQFTDRAGSPLLAEMSTPTPQKGVSQRFNPGTDEAFYGRPAPERADESQRRGRRARSAQHGYRGAVRAVESQLRRAMGQQRRSRASAIRSLMARVARSQDPRCRGQGRRVHCAYTINGELKLERVEPDINYQFIKDLRELAEGIAHGQGSATTGIAA